jgi:hypothetical protein
MEQITHNLPIGMEIHIKQGGLQEQKDKLLVKVAGPFLLLELLNHSLIYSRHNILIMIFQNKIYCHVAKQGIA